MGQFATGPFRADRPGAGQFPLQRVVGPDTSHDDGRGGVAPRSLSRSAAMRVSRPAVQQTAHHCGRYSRGERKRSTTFQILKFELARPRNHPGKSRGPLLPWVPAFAGMVGILVVPRTSRSSLHDRRHQTMRGRSRIYSGRRRQNSGSRSGAWSSGISLTLTISLIGSRSHRIACISCRLPAASKLRPVLMPGPAAVDPVQGDGSPGSGPWMQTWPLQKSSRPIYSKLRRPPSVTI